MKRIMLLFIALCIIPCALYAYTSNVAEVGIVALPSQEISKQAKQFNKSIYNYLLKQDAQIINAANIPHLSFYQLAIPVDRLNDLEKSLSSIAYQTKSFSINLDNKLKIQGGNIFWNAIDFSAFKELENTILSSNITDLRQGYLRQLEDPKTLSAEKQQLVKQYGIYWIKKLATPHITIFYDIPEQDKGLAGYLKQLNVATRKFTVKYLAYGLLDYSGNVVKIIKAYPLK